MKVTVTASELVSLVTEYLRKKYPTHTPESVMFVATRRPLSNVSDFVAECELSEKTESGFPAPGFFAEHMDRVYQDELDKINGVALTAEVTARWAKESAEWETIANELMAQRPGGIVTAYEVSLLQRERMLARGERPVFGVPSKET